MDAELEALAHRVGAALKSHQSVLAVAESCTGGWIAEVVTSVSGSSEWFDRGWVTYSNNSKLEMLGVAEDTLHTFGAVSEEVAREMVSGALARSHARVALSVTGIAGPSGGTAQKPVGTVCFAWCQPGHKIASMTQRFGGDREQVRRQSVVFALEHLLHRLDVR